MLRKYNTYAYSWKHRGNGCLPFFHVAHEDKGNRRNVPSSIKTCEATCLTFICRKLHGVLAETASHRTCRGIEHYFQGTLLVQRDLMPKMAEVITSLHCNHNWKQMPEGILGKTSSAVSTFTVLPSQNCCKPFPAGTCDLYQWCKVNANYYQIPTKSKSCVILWEIFLQGGRR